MSFITPGETLRKIRTQLNITQNELESAGISRNFISMFEVGKRKLSRETCDKIIDRLNNIAAQKGVSISQDLEYLYESPKKAAKKYCINQLNNTLNELSIDEVIYLCQEYKFEHMLRQAIIVKANIIYDETKYREAFYCYQEALEMSIRFNEDCDLSMLYNKLGKCKLELLNYEEALIFFKKSYQYAIMNKDLVYTKNSLFNIALSYKKIGAVDEALINIDKFINLISREQHLDDYVNAAILKANCYMTNNSYLEALNLYKHLESILLGSSNLLLGYIYNNIGVIYLNLENSDEALLNFEKAEDFRIKFDKPNLAYTLIDKSKVYIKTHLLGKAIKLIEEGINIAHSFNDIFCAMKGYLVLEKIYLQISNLNKLQDTYISMLNILNQTDDTNQINAIQTKLALLNINSGNIEKSKMYLENVTNIKIATHFEGKI